MVDAKRLVSEGAAVMSELEKMTKKIMASARDRARESFEDNANRDEK